MFAYAYANATWFSKATISSWVGNWSSCCPWLQNNVCVHVQVHKCVKESYISLEHLWSPLMPPLPCAHRGSLTWIQWGIHPGGNFLIFSLSFAAQNYDYQTQACARHRRDWFHSITMLIMICKDVLCTKCMEWSMRSSVVSSCGGRNQTLFIQNVYWCKL